jgi:hypothetical protein
MTTETHAQAWVSGRSHGTDAALRTIALNLATYYRAIKLHEHDPDLRAQYVVREGTTAVLACMIVDSCDPAWRSGYADRVMTALNARSGDLDVLARAWEDLAR